MPQRKISRMRSNKMSYHWIANGVEIIAEPADLKEIAWRINHLYSGMVWLYLTKAPVIYCLTCLYCGSGVN